ncbi:MULTISPECIES: Rieske (2Fe-2S) protein [Pseudomonas]|uniref:(2Fe-2S)-binding protein n=1 Tax=Pseudomonas guariconensis TaxID=1288410 RepID=A0AAX0VWB1_9PSED|nr:MULTISPECIES: Rieske 2Fe-2S domain-containing protein [Pseudomonas]MBF8755429.1 Rieske 2Fe-2S domain-containing protein [Pseudomonas guariconensis]MDD2091178.1 Rieske 2Fe-2S domain-containing protein [Pseudomonas guariconensis]MDM9593507.1 Rieske 2Fe-2S domain-containing protein [Pseudomonas guariconensis]MDM9606334.1 Rieske 2Fe-2S domain-containing protein [Pseudomonas guariconensis]MDM9611291.1 Rieske 2Fe-2S domain-containing protein [Pseudomonas guariconensis]
MSRRVAVPPGKLPPRNGRALFEYQDKSLALFDVEGVLYVIDDSCPHQGASLCGGRLEGRIIQCCAHGLRFDLTSGYLLNSTVLKVARYPVEREGEAVFILIEAEVAC